MAAAFCIPVTAVSWSHISNIHWCPSDRGTSSTQTSEACCLDCWYRPPGADAYDISSLDEELNRLSVDMIGALIVGDMNVWHKSWLKHSHTDTVDGANLHQICKLHGLKQLVTEPTRGANLLDLALSSVPASCSAKVLSVISDHA